MTSPALGVLALALVCSIFGTASEQTADRASKHTTHRHHLYQQIDDIIDKDTTTSMNKPTNIGDVPINDHFKTVADTYDEIFIEETNFVNSKHIYDSDKLKTNDYIAQYEIDEYRSKIENKNQDIITEKYLNFGEDRARKFDMKSSKWKGTERVPSSSQTLKRVKREEDAEKCEKFIWKPTGNAKLQHPHNTSNVLNKNYYSNLDCVTVIRAEEGQVIKLTFVDVFHIEDHPKCQYDYLEIRNGRYGYAKLSGKYCGSTFPPQVISSGPYLWLKFHSDETIEYEGFSINVEYYNDVTSHKIPDVCYLNKSGVSGVIDTSDIPADCKTRSLGHALDVLWTIETEADTNIYLNFTSYELAKPNECEENVVQIYGYVLEFDEHLAHYCGSVANPVATNSNTKTKMKVEIYNKMYVHFYASQNAVEKSKFSATFTAFRSLNPAKDEKCRDNEFNCEDNTCIALNLTCQTGYAHCRLKADVDDDLCQKKTESIITEPHILVILVIFSLILSGMSFVFLFKCLRKLYQDHKIIKEHISQSCEDRLDRMISDSRFTLDPKRLQRDSEPRASLERENHTNELFKQQRSISQHKQSSIDSDFQETHLDLDDEPWRREVETIPEALDIKVEPQRNGRTRRSDTSKKEESMRSRKDIAEEREKKEIRDAAVGAPDTKESGCQTRESLFQDPPPSSDGSNSNGNSRGFSTFGYSGATLVRPSPPPAHPAPPAPLVSSAHIELLRQLPAHESTKQKKLPDRRPMSTETTRSAPDVIIVSKPIR